MENYIELLKLILPELIVEHFDLVSTKIEQEKMHLFFEEKNTPPKEFNNRQLVSKGFLNEITIQDFPLRGKLVYLYIKRRRWTDKESQAIIQRDWNIIAQGTRVTQEFADFLKEIMNTIKINYDSILNYFDNRSTNASAESFNAKIKAFRNQFRGVRKVDFFLFRLTKLFA
ncbi:transposase [Flavobacterium ovatum]|uniref:ISAon1 family transposase N-terminal region protein n=1 Tax=Flavobacterium ovatum TaxID=1928857 RepID=UPI00344D1BC4